MSQIQLYVLPEEKEKLIKKAMEDGRPLANFCRKILLKEVSNEPRAT